MRIGYHAVEERSNQFTTGRCYGVKLLLLTRVRNGLIKDVLFDLLVPCLTTAYDVSKIQLRIPFEDIMTFSPLSCPTRRTLGPQGIIFI